MVSTGTGVIVSGEEPKVCELGIIAENLMEKMLKDGQQPLRVVISLMSPHESGDPTTEFLTADYRKDSVFAVIRNYRSVRTSEDYLNNIESFEKIDFLCKNYFSLT